MINRDTLASVFWIMYRAVLYALTYIERAAAAAFLCIKVLTARQKRNYPRKRFKESGRSWRQVENHQFMMRASYIALYLHSNVPTYIYTFPYHTRFVWGVAGDDDSLMRGGGGGGKGEERAFPFRIPGIADSGIFSFSDDIILRLLAAAPVLSWAAHIGTHSRRSLFHNRFYFLSRAAI